MGDLSSLQQPDFALVPVLQKLHNEGHTGRLQVRPPQGSYGAIYFEQGEIVHAAHMTLSGLDAFVSVVAWNIALHSFRPNIKAKAYTVELSFSDLLLLLSQSEQALKQLAGSPTELTPRATAPETPVRTPNHSSGRGRAGNPAVRSVVVPQTFLDELTALFVDVKGPIADIIMEDVCYDMGYDLNRLPSRELRAFYKRLLKEISDPEAQQRFVASLKALEARY